jgi:enoyl-CoA hydratase
MSNERVFIEREGEMGILTINDPPANSLSGGVIEALDKDLDKVLADESCKCIVLTGSGDRPDRSCSKRGCPAG